MSTVSQLSAACRADASRDLPQSRLPPLTALQIRTRGRIIRLCTPTSARPAMPLVSQDADTLRIATADNLCIYVAHERWPAQIKPEITDQARWVWLA